MSRILVVLALGLVLAASACGRINLPLFGGRDAPSTAAAPGPDEPRPSERPGVDAAAETGGAPVEAGVLGTTLATLGDAGVSGLWLETPLVAAVQQGRITSDSGTSATVELRPSGGAPGSGSRISLQAMQALGLPLTAIAELRVEAL
ncbi:hypothetical protein HKCCE3408_14290 [Rhodobacterales bacterium HKCCE3408]|nr:hypothetical protein [Rhodobacterales bacterium HKCCE3408]